MKKKISLILVVLMFLFAFGSALTLAQENSEDSQETVVEETVETEEEVADDAEDSDAVNSETEDETENGTEDEPEVSYENLDQLLTAIQENEELNNIEKVTLERKLTSYEENLSIETMTSVVDKILAEEVDLGQGFVILNNLDQSINNGLEEEKALELINSYQNEADNGQFSFQTALELRKLSREDSSGEKTEAFAAEIASIIEENGEIETSQLKQLSAKYRKEAREEERAERINKGSKNYSSASENALENRQKNNASEKSLKKDNQGNGNSNKQKSNGKGKSSGKSPNSNANKNAKK